MHLGTSEFVVIVAFFAGLTLLRFISPEGGHRGRSR